MATTMIQITEEIDNLIDLCTKDLDLIIELLNSKTRLTGVINIVNTEYQHVSIRGKLEVLRQLKEFIERG